jgi:hypothetical protein
MGAVLTNLKKERAMADTNSNKESCVAGFVKGPVDNHDKSLSFWIAKKKFVVASEGEHAKMLKSAKRALVRFTASETRNPKILLVLAEPSSLLIRQHMQS